MGNSISDILYPDNPNRRARAEQLKSDIDSFCQEFNEAEKSRDEVLAEIRPRLGEFLKKCGYNSPEELDERVRSILKDDALSEYLKLRDRYNKNSDIEQTIFQICSIVTVATGVFIGALVALSIITGGAALAAMGVIGLALAAVAGLVVFIEVFEGDEERSKLQDAIRSLAPERVKARMCLQEMKAIVSWVNEIKDWLDDPDISENPDRIKKKLEGDFKEDFSKADMPHVVEYLKKLDRDRNAWTNEDPDWQTSVDSSYSAEFIQPQAHIDYDCQINKEKGTLQLTVLDCDKTSCTGQDTTGGKWSLVSESVQSQGATKLSEHCFSIKNLQSGKVLSGCRLTTLSPAPISPRKWRQEGLTHPLPSDIAVGAIRNILT